MFIFIHLKADGTAHWATIAEPRIPDDTLEPGDSGIVVQAIETRFVPTEEPKD